jgi:hypothetical protein
VFGDWMHYQPLCSVIILDIMAVFALFLVLILGLAAKFILSFCKCCSCLVSIAKQWTISQQKGLKSF